MKRIFSISLLVVFIFSTVGVIANSYSCPMMKTSSKMCCDMGCCKHEVKLLKVKDDFISSTSFSLSKIFSPAIILFTANVSENYFPLSVFQFPQNDHPPPGKIIDRLSFIQSFLI